MSALLDYLAFQASNPEASPANFYRVLALGDAALSEAQRRIGQLEAGLLEVEAHHVDINGRVNRPQENSATLAIVREALAP